MTRMRRNGTKERKERYPAGPQPSASQVNLQEVSVLERLQAVRYVLEEGLSRVERLIDGGCFLNTNRQLEKLEFDDERQFFIQKLTAIRQSLQLMADRLELPASFPENKRVLQVELFALTVIVEGARANHLVTGDSAFDQKVREVLADSIENITLDLLNLRARVK